MIIHPNAGNTLQRLRNDIPAAADALCLDMPEGWRRWTHALDVKLLPKLQAEFPLVIAICGGGSAGKSTLFNSLIGDQVSPTGGKAGLNRRVLAAVHERHRDNGVLFATLAHTLGGPLSPMHDARQLTAPGDPVYCVQTHLPEKLVLLDTPDIDTGARGNYANRELARRSLESADAFVYIFTNATYNNRDNTDFIAELLTGIGIRPCFLVYRVYPSFSDVEVREHAATVAQNLYGPGHAAHVLGIFRADDDNRVAAGRRPMTLSAIDGGPGLRDAMVAIDGPALRQTLLSSMMADALHQARQMDEALHAAHERLAAYIEALEAAQRSAVQQALSHFPSDQVLRRFADIWRATDPTHIKVMRRTGQVVEWPLKLVLSAARKLRSEEQPSLPDKRRGDPGALLELDLLQAANALYQATVTEHIQDGAQDLAAPPCVREAQANLRRRDWQAALTRIQAQKELILSWSGGLEQDLKVLAEELRGRMGLVDQVRQTFAAFLNVIPATAAITYILHTGDPAGAVGIKVKLTGLLGLHDLYALIAIPATAGMKKADQQQLEQMLAPVARTWLAHKLTAVQQLFEAQITAEVLDTARSAHGAAGKLIDEIDGHLKLVTTVRP
ncbi:GTPase [Desulfatitalea tepidiphila]|uniref:GTPase n=1 Tax=Desulfatitalea tepidiphila TaxID=1185843 RepID=UPI0006B4CF6D|nr:GTPase [Desulfatitalea tepidiphila]